MQNPLKQLAGETAIYGLSTILARFINFLFVPIYTNVLLPGEYGIYSWFMSYIALLQVVFVLGLETGCFRFASKEGADSNAVYSNALVAVIGLNSAFLALMIVFSGPIAGMLGNIVPKNSIIQENCIMYVGGILALDSITAILFAKLRQEHKSIKFATFKSIKILTETLVNLLLFYPFKGFCLSAASAKGVEVSALGADDVWLLHFVSPTPDFAYPIFATFVSCVVCGLLFLPSLLRFSFKLDRKLLKQMLVYSLPIMVAGLPGVANDFLDRFLFPIFDTNADEWSASLGIYQAAVKLAVIMNLFIQMFRYASEPFFFQRSKEKDSNVLYAKVMEYFTAFCGLIFLGVILYLDVIALILGKDFRGGIDVVPLMLIAYMFNGMLFNVSMWYKLSGKTKAAVWITLTGLAVTAIVNVVFMPIYSYRASAFGHLASSFVMLVMCAWLGNKYYPIPYKWGRIILIFVLMVGIYLMSGLTDSLYFPGVSFGHCSLGHVIVKLGVHTLFLLVYLAVCYLLFRRRKQHC